MNNEFGKKIVLIAFCCALLVVSKEVLAFLPNIELVTFLLILYSLNFELSISLFISIGFCFIQMILYGIGPWTPMYFIVWSFLVILTVILKKWLKDEHRCAVFSGIFGLFFGFLFSIPYFLMDWNLGVAYFLKGIPFDLIHCVGNYLLMLLLYERCNDVIKKVVLK